MSQKILEIVIQAKNEAEKTLGKVQNDLKSINKQNENLINTAKTAGKVGAVAFAGIATVVGLSVKAYGEAERSQRQLEHAIIGVSQGTAEQVKQVNEITKALEKKAGIDADSINAGVAQLSTFGLQTKSVIDLTKSLADLTVNQNGVSASADDYISSANIMAKALRGEFGMLTKMGIRFTEHQQELIMTGTEQQKVATIIEGFNQNLRETTDTVAGYDKSLGQLTTTFGNILEGVGGSLQPALLGLGDALLPILTSVSEFVQNNPKLTVGLIAVGVAISGLLIVVGLLAVALPAIISGFAVLGVSAGAILPIMAGVSAFIAGLILIMYNLYNIVTLLGTQWNLIWAGIKITFAEIVANLKKQFEFFINDIPAGILKIAEAFIPFIKQAESAYKVIEKLVNKAKELGGGAVSALKGVFGGGKASGGGVQVGKTYLTGEQGPELFTPATTGSITPNHQLAGAGGGMNLTINMNGTFMDDADRVAEKLGDKIVQNFKLLSRF
jgi:hypothetical protein